MKNKPLEIDTSDGHREKSLKKHNRKKKRKKERRGWEL